MGISRQPKFWLRIIILGILIALLYKAVDFSSILKIVGQFSFATLLILVLIDFVFIGVESLRMYILGSYHYPYWPTVRSKFLAQFFGLILPGLTGAELVRILLLDRWRPKRKFFLLLLIVSNRLYGLLGIAAILFTAILVDEQLLPASLLPYKWYLLALCAYLVICPLFFNLRWMRKLTIGALRILPKKLKKSGRVFYLALSTHCQFKYWLGGMATSGFNGCLLVIQYWLLAKGLGITLGFVNWAMWAPVIALGTYLPIGFGGFGSQDATFAFIALQENLPIESFLAMSLILHGMRVFLSVIGVAFIRDAEAMVDEFSQSKVIKWVTRRLHRPT